MGSIEKIIAQSFLKMAEGLETGAFMDRPKIALTGMGSEHGEENAMAAAKMAAKRGVDVYYIGTLTAEGVTTIPVANDEEGHKKMEEMLNNHEVDGAVTMHYPFPIGVSTVGRAITPAKGREMFIANHGHQQRRPHRGHDKERRFRHYHRQGLRRGEPHGRYTER